MFWIVDKQRTRHIDNALIVKTNGTDLFKASEEYRGQLMHAKNGISLTQFKFNSSSLTRLENTQFL